MTKPHYCSWARLQREQLEDFQETYAANTDAWVWAWKVCTCGGGQPDTRTRGKQIITVSEHDPDCLTVELRSILDHGNKLGDPVTGLTHAIPGEEK